jgi:hypothetical protein
MGKGDELRQKLVRVALKWERYFGVAPHITTAISELDAAKLVGMNESEYCKDGLKRTAVTKGVDFFYNGIRYQVTANRPSGKKGSKVTLVKQKTEKKGPFGWDRLIWILYDSSYEIQEAWEFSAKQYRQEFSAFTRLSPSHMRKGKPLLATKK